MTKRWWSVIAGLLIMLVGVILLLVQLEMITLSGPLWGGIALLGGASIFLALWLGNPTEWWPLIPGCIMAGWGAAALLASLGVADWMVTLIGFGATVLPFVYLFFKLGPSEGWWALIPGGVVGAWGLGTVLGEFGLHDSVVTFVGFVGSAVPFLIIFAMNRKENWWALIPGGVMGLMGVVTTLGRIVGEEWTATFVLLGISLTFLGVFVWNRRQWWALIPAGVLALVGVGVAPVSGAVTILWAVGLMGVGGFLLVRALLPRSGDV